MRKHKKEQRKKFSPPHMFILSSLCLGHAALLPSSALAQETGEADSWDFKAYLYLWGAGIDATSRLGNEIEIGFGDVVENLDFAFMGAFEARKSKWSLAADLLYLDVSAGRAGTIGPGLPVNADVDVTGWVVNLQGAYNVVDVEAATTDILLGARYLEFDSTLRLALGATGPAPSATLSGSVWDGVVGVKGDVRITDRWYLPYYLDVGTGQSDLTWQGIGGVGYRFDWGNLALVYRHLAWEFDSSTLLKDTSFSGPALAAVFTF